MVATIKCIVYMGCLASFSVDSFPEDKPSLAALERLQIAARISLFESIGAELKYFVSSLFDSGHQNLRQPSTSSEESGRWLVEKWLQHCHDTATWRLLLESLKSSVQSRNLATVVNQFFSVSALKEEVRALKQSREEALQREDQMQQDIECLKSNYDILNKCFTRDVKKGERKGKSEEEEGDEGEEEEKEEMAEGEYPERENIIQVCSKEVAVYERQVKDMSQQKEEAEKQYQGGFLCQTCGARLAMLCVTGSMALHG